jgi:hypothetical protein
MSKLESYLTYDCKGPPSLYPSNILRRMNVPMNDGTKAEDVCGDIVVIPPRRKVVGDEPCVMIGFRGLKDYARKE